MSELNAIKTGICIKRFAVLYPNLYLEVYTMTYTNLIGYVVLAILIVSTIAIAIMYPVSTVLLLGRMVYVCTTE